MPSYIISSSSQSVGDGVSLSVGKSNVMDPTYTSENSIPICPRSGRRVFSPLRLSRTVNVKAYESSPDDG